MSATLSDLSVIIPFTQSDILWKDLLQDLRTLPAAAEIILVGPQAPDAQLLERAKEGVIANIRYVYSEKGRGRQLNAGAKAAKNNFFWFVHADTKIPRPAIYNLGFELARHPRRLHYFHLQFLDDGPKLVGLNSFAANLRSRYLGMPFGDQAFAVSRQQFFALGGFSEAAPYGEDHMFVWAAHRNQIKLNQIDSSVFTSARKYESEGWGLLTSKRVYLTAKQATSECIKLLKQKVLEQVNRTS